MFDEKSHSLKMDKAIEVFSKELSSLRTGRANASMLDIIKVDVYGQQMPINQIGSITTPEPRMINIQVWDCLLYTSPSPRDGLLSRMPSSA